MISLRPAGFGLLALPLACASPPIAADGVSGLVDVVEAEFEAGRFMGSVLVARDGSVLLDRGFGSANLEWEIPNAPDTRFRIGSITKQFTAVSILLLQERGLLDIDEPVRTYWPGAPATWEAITVRHLLEHTSGIPNLTRLDDFETFKLLPTTKEQVIDRFVDLPLEARPGERWQYSNSNYIVLTAIVEGVSGQPYIAFLEEYVFDPLGMAETGLDVPAEILERRASGYTLSDGRVVNAEHINMEITRGGGQLVSTTHDLLRWQRGLFGGEVLSPESLADYTTSRTDRYALGVIVESDEDGTTIWHSGGIEGFNAWLGYDPARRITVAVLANLEVPGPSRERAATRLGVTLMELARGVGD